MSITPKNIFSFLSIHVVCYTATNGEKYPCGFLLSETPEMMSIRLKHENCYQKINHMCVRNPIKGEWHEAQILQNIFSQ
ncbi:CLUMA_CG007179, isoform A [Clunio marinus]|uniref:CLUMA_CG007179, isoform A n=1 Tax=Clunio marinus TaxID=568069 RepID=A0A1J1I1M1_9DIPT|nr:CLUMA_CG007179, isoform A [Clunio marinus]